MASVTDNINLWAPVDKGEIIQTPTPDNTSKPTKGTSELGKDAFLQLLVAQMKYQDPLNPTSDTEWISQLATFSSLEEMQNMSATMSNSQALNLVGEMVIINNENKLIGGKVDYVTLVGGKAYLAVKGELYSIDDLDTVASEEYLNQLLQGGNKPVDPDKPEESDGDKTEDDKTEDDKQEDTSVKN